MNRTRKLLSRRGQIPTGTLIMMVGVSDILTAGVLWYLLGQDNMMMTIIFGLLAVTGLGVTVFGAMQNLK
ncbi:hypothetical protein GC197_13355 [bacterium]|nr:hypothetical protein [bacterium]